MNYGLGYTVYNPKHGMSGQIVAIIWSETTHQLVYTIQYANGMYRRYFEDGLDKLGHPVNTDWPNWNIDSSKHKCTIINLCFE